MQPDINHSNHDGAKKATEPTPTRLARRSFLRNLGIGAALLSPGVALLSSSGEALAKNGNGKKKWSGTVVEIHVPGHINFKWNHSNLENSIRLGYDAAKQAIGAFKEAEDEIKANKNGKLPKPIFINENPQDDPKWIHLRDHTYAGLKKAASGAKPK